MAQLKDTIVSGNLRVTDTTLTDTLQVTTIKAPTSSGESTYGPGTSGQVLKSNGTTVYWGSDSNSVTGVKGNAESSYRTGNVNLTPANIGALALSGGTMTGNITFTPVTSTSYPASSNQLYWSGSTDWAKIYYRVDASDAGKLVFDIGDDTNTRIAFAYNGTAKSYIDTDGNFSGNAANVTGTVAIAHGGTGATTRLAALRALTGENVGTSAQYFLTITDSWGKGGYTSVGNAKTVLGLKSAAYTESSDYVPNTNAGVNAAINLLSTGDSTPSLADYYVSQYANGGTTTTSYHRRPISLLWNTFKELITLTTTGSGNGVTDVSIANDGDHNRKITVTKGSTFSLSTHTHNYAGSSSAGGPALSANKLNTDAGGTYLPVYFSSGVPTAVTVKNNTAKGTIGWTSGAAANAALVTVNSIAYWDGAYNGTSSNLTYCNRGAFGTIVTKSATDYSKVSITRNLTSGTKVGTITIDGTSTDLYCQTNTNTTYTLGTSGNNVILTPSSGSVQSITVPYASNAAASNSLKITGYGNSNLTFYQANDDFGGTEGRKGNDGDNYWSHYIIANHGNGETYYHYTLRLPFWGSPQYQRKTGGSTATANRTKWLDFITEENYTSYTVTKTGGGASGTWGISVTGSSASCTGNAASAAKLETARNIALAEDFAGSANFDGSGNISISGTFYRCSASSYNTANYPWHRIAYRTGVTDTYNDTDAIFMIKASYNGGPFGIIKVSMRTNGSGANCQVAARWLVRQNIAANDVYIAQWGKTGQSVYADIFLKGTIHNRAYVYQIAGSRLWTLVNSNEASNTTTSDKKTSTEVYASIAAAGTTLHNQAYTQTVAGIDEGHVNSANSATYATRADYVNVVGTNEIRFYNDNQFNANNRFWIGHSWAQGSHYTPSGGSDTSSMTAPNITEFLMGNCSGGGLASVHAKTFILGNGSSPTISSKTTTITTAATTTDRTITLPDDSGTVALTSKTFNVTRGSSVSTATAGYWAAMCNSSSTGSPVLPTSGKWWYVISMGWLSDTKNWISQLAIATQDGSGVWWRRHTTGGTSIDSFSWNRLAEGDSSGAATSANKLNTDAGSTSIPVYFSGGVPIQCTTPNAYQTNTTTNADYRVLFSTNANDTTQSGTTRKNINLKYNPSTATLKIGEYVSGSSATKTGKLVFGNSLNVYTHTINTNTDKLSNVSLTLNSTDGIMGTDALCYKGYESANLASDTAPGSLADISSLSNAVSFSGYLARFSYFTVLLCVGTDVTARTTVQVSAIAGYQSYQLIWGGAPNHSGGNLSITSGLVNISESSGTITLNFGKCASYWQFSSSSSTPTKGTTPDIHVLKVYGHSIRSNGYH